MPPLNLLLRGGPLSVPELASIHLHSFSIQHFPQPVAVRNHVYKPLRVELITQDPLGGKVPDLQFDAGRAQDPVQNVLLKLTHN